jgi:monoamine oxidase
MNRRDFMAAGTLTLLGCTRKTDASLPPGELLGPSLGLGHRLRDGGGFPAPGETRKVGALIVGGGMAGLACGWWLKRHGVDDFALLEMEHDAGGNARSGENAVSRYPWGAHYLPLPGPDAPEIRTMLAEFGVLRGDPMALKPDYDERYLVFAPQERLFINGHWQEGLLPQFGVSSSERAQQQRFLQHMASLKASRQSGRPAYTVPSRRSATPDPGLQRVSMHDWLIQQGYTAPSLHWLVNYGCRDDYGTDYRQVSAWAGLHYHASRHGEAGNAESDDVLVWPEGNGWLTRQLAARVGPQLVKQAMATHIECDTHGVTVDVYLTGENRSVRYRADQLVWAAPTAFLPHAWPTLPSAWRQACQQISYAPWLVANLTLRDYPDESGHVPLCWDNVPYGTAGLGYVVATHQRLDVRRRDTVLTYYRPLSALTPAEARKQLLATSREHWAASILNELAPAHPDLASLTTRLDVWRWGHAMARPVVGLTTDTLAALRTPQDRALLAHADLSGFSIAEEAHYWGIRAARWLLQQPDWNTA